MGSSPTGSMVLLNIGDLVEIHHIDTTRLCLVVSVEDVYDGVNYIELFIPELGDVTHRYLLNDSDLSVQNTYGVLLLQR